MIASSASEDRSVQSRRFAGPPYPFPCEDGITTPARLQAFADFNSQKLARCWRAHKIDPAQALGVSSWSTVKALKPAAGQRLTP
jgi:hypothetical protein